MPVSGVGHRTPENSWARSWSLCSAGSFIVPVEECRLPAIVPMKPLGTDRHNQQWQHTYGVVPVAVIVPVFPSIVHIPVFAI